MVTLEGLRLNRDAVLRIAAEHGARNIRVFGAVARGESSNDGDLDLLVDWAPKRGLLGHVALVRDLQELLGVKVQIATERSLHWYALDRVLSEAQPL